MVPVKVLLTGFNRFDALEYNPSEVVVSEIGRIAQRGLASHLVSIVLPTEYDRASEMMRQYIRSFCPDVVVATGVSPSREFICLERIALNIDEVEVADNAGSIRDGSPIDPSGPLAMQTNCSLTKILERLRDRGFPSIISTNAGTYVCNHIYYVSLQCLQELGSNAKCLFTHLPMPANQVRSVRSNDYLWTIEKLVEAVQLIIVESINQAEGHASELV
jgi:pyroglutamyl-peptidase